ncbi:MAG: RDD family protein [Bryocella sp.]
MSGAAQRVDGTTALDFDSSEPAVTEIATEGAATESTLKQAVAERLAAHRQKRAQQQRIEAEILARHAVETPSQHAGARVREAVAARYQKTQSYREFLAVEADRALNQAQAEAEVAARKAQAVAQAKHQIMEEIAQWDETPARVEGVFAPAIGASHEQQSLGTIVEEHRTEVRGELAHAIADIALGARELMAEVRFEEAQRQGLTIQLVEEVTLPAVPERGRTSIYEDSVQAELDALEQEIEYRLSPGAEAYVLEAQPLPANIIEFPRQLVAPKKARPRLAEGPLRVDAPVEPQLRIFEVEAEQISSEPESQMTAAPEWQSLTLESNTEAVVNTPNQAQAQFTLTPQTASIERRLMAAAVDFVCVGAALACFVAVAVEVGGSRLWMMPRPIAIGSAAGIFLLLLIAYQLLFFSLNGDTVGMRYARISLCTFGDRNPTRKEMRRRVFALLLAASPLGIGLAWAFLDDERLGWHDRMSRMYQRSY